MNWRDELPELPTIFDEEPQAIELFLEKFNVKIEADYEKPCSGWAVGYSGGAGIMCPFLKGDDDGKKARKVIALSVYLHLKGVDASLCDRLAYWYVQGPFLLEIKT